MQKLYADTVALLSNFSVFNRKKHNPLLSGAPASVYFLDMFLAMALSTISNGFCNSFFIRMEFGNSINSRLMMGLMLLNYENSLLIVS